LNKYKNLILTNNPNLEFRDISAELWRTYVYPDGSEVTIKHPVAVALTHTSKPFGGGSHRVVDRDGIGHYVPSGWNHLFWDNSAGDERISW
jgi:hypothetical protein